MTCGFSCHLNGVAHRSLTFKSETADIEGSFDRHLMDLINGSSHDHWPGGGLSDDDSSRGAVGVPGQ